MVLKVEASFLQHAEQDHSADPKLDAQQILPVESRKDEPKRGKDKIISAHDAVEVQHRQILCRKQSVRTLELDRDGGIEIVL